MKAKVRFNGARIRKAAKRANITNLAHAGAAIRLTARRSIKRAPKDRDRDAKGRFTSQGNTQPSPPGKPPHTRKGALKQAILYGVEKQKERVVIGPSHAIIGESGKAHEFGGRYRGQRYPKRPFMQPALMVNLPKLPRMWRASVR